MLIQEAFQSGHLSLWWDRDEAALDQLRHLLFAEAPIALDSEYLVKRIALRCATRTRQVIPPVSTPGSIDVAVVRFYVIRIVGSVLRVPSNVGSAPHVEQECVVSPAVVLATLLRIAMRGGSLPGDLVDEVLRREDRVHQHLQVMARGRVAVQVDAPGCL